MDTVLKIFPNVGDKLSVASAYAKLKAYYGPNDPYAEQKAAGSLGGASKAGTIKLINGYWERVR